MSENYNDHEQLVDALEPMIATELIDQENLPRSANKGNNLRGQGGYNIKLREWLGRSASIERSKILAAHPQERQPAF